MSLARRAAYPMLASIFIAGGLDAIRNPASKVKSAEAVTVPLTRRLSWLPQNTETLVRLNGAVQVGAGGLMAAGKFRRLAAIALIGSIIPTTYAGHRFWEEVDDVTRAQQRTHLLKNLGLLGGLILAALDTDGAPSVGWRARRSARRLSAAMAIGRTVGATRATAGATKALKTGVIASEVAARGASKVAARGANHANDVAWHLTREGLKAVGPHLSADRADELPSRVH